MTIAPPCPAVLRGHALDRLPAAEHQADHIHRHQPLKLLAGHLVGPNARRNAGAVHERIDLSEASLGFVEHPDDIGFISDIGLHRHRALARSRNGRNRRLGSRTVIPVADGDIEAPACRKLRDRPAYPAGPARDQQNLAHPFPPQ